MEVPVALRARTSTTHYISYSKLGEFVSKVFKLGKYRFDILETPNDTDYAVGVKKEPLDEYQLEEIEEMKEQKGCEHYRLGTLMQYLANEDLIPEGDYVIEVCW